MTVRNLCSTVTAKLHFNLLHERVAAPVFGCEISTGLVQLLLLMLLTTGLAAPLLLASADDSPPLFVVSLGKLICCLRFSKLHFEVNTCMLILMPLVQV